MRVTTILALMLVAVVAPAACGRPWWRGQPIKRLGQGQQQFRPNNLWLQQGQQDPEAVQEMRERMAEQAERDAEAAQEIREQEEEAAQELREQQAEAAQQMPEQQGAFAAQGMRGYDPEALQELQEQEAERAQEMREQEAEAAEDLREQEAEAAQNMQEQEAEAAEMQGQDAEGAESETEAAEMQEQEAEAEEAEVEGAEELQEQEAEAAEAEAEAAEELLEQQAEAAEAEAEAREEGQGEAAEGGEGIGGAGGSLGTSFSAGGSTYGQPMGSGSAGGPSFYSPTGGLGGYGGSGSTGGSSYGGYQGGSGGMNGVPGGAMGGTVGAGGVTTGGVGATTGGTGGATTGVGGAPGDIPGGGNIGANGGAPNGAPNGAAPDGAANGVAPNGAAPDGAANGVAPNGAAPNGGQNGAAPDGAANGAAPDGAANGAANGVAPNGTAGAGSAGGANGTRNGTVSGGANGATNEAANGGVNGGANGGVNGGANGGAAASNGMTGTAGASQGASTSTWPSSFEGGLPSMGNSFVDTTNLGTQNEPNIAFAPAPIAAEPLTPEQTAALDNTYMDKHLCGGFLGANGISGKKDLAVLALDYAGMKQALDPCNIPTNGRTTGRTPVNVAFRGAMETHGQDPASAVLRDLPGMIQRYGQTPSNVHLFSWFMPSEHALRSLLTKKRRGGLANTEVALGYVEETKMALFSALLGDTTFTNLLGQLQQAGISVNRICDTCQQMANMTNWQRKRQGLVNGVGVFDQQAGQCGPVADVPAADQLALSAPQCQNFQESMGSCLFGKLTEACPWLRHAQTAAQSPLASIMEAWSTDCGKNLACWQGKGAYLSYLARESGSCRVSQYGASAAIGQCVGAGKNTPLDPAPPAEPTTI